jgi:4-hydroxybenzoate polyprenyltransferase
VVGQTYAAKQEADDRIGAVWPLLVLAVPLVIAAFAAWGQPLALLGWFILVGWMGWALRYLFRRAPGDVPRAVVALIAGIALYDAILIAGTGDPWLAGLAVVGFVLTLLLQRVAPGT